MPLAHKLSNYFDYFANGIYFSYVVEYLREIIQKEDGFLENIFKEINMFISFNLNGYGCSNYRRKRCYC